MKIKENNKLGLININRLLKCNFTKKVLRGPFSIPTRLGCYVKRNRSGQMNRATSKEHEAQIPHHHAKISHEQLRSARDPNTHSPTPSANHVHIYIYIYILFYCLRQQFHFRPIQEMASTYRDRTAEFRSLSETLKKIGGITAVHHQQPENDPASSKPLTTPPPPLPPAVAAANSSRSEFNKKASRIGLGIQETSHKITRLAQCKLICIVFYTVIVYLVAAKISWLKLK